MLRGSYSDSIVELMAQQVEASHRLLSCTVKKFHCVTQVVATLPIKGARRILLEKWRLYGR